MYQHIGKKLKILAKIWCVLGAAASVAAGVLFYLGIIVKLDLAYCIAIAVGGVICFVLSSWGIYALGDVQAKLERLEEKLIPKPSYMNYLEGNQGLRGKCEICGKTTDLINAKIVDKMGTRYRKVCRDCFSEHKCEDAE